MWKQFSLRGIYKWQALMPTTAAQYDSREHGTIRRKPQDLKKKHEQMLLSTLYNRIKLIDQRKNKFKVGNFFILSQYREAFFKKYTPIWSEETFEIVDEKSTNAIYFMKVDSEGKRVMGIFCHNEL